jgi:hypothetical protein
VITANEFQSWLTSDGRYFGGKAYPDTTVTLITTNLINNEINTYTEKATEGVWSFGSGEIGSLPSEGELKLSIVAEDFEGNESDPYITTITFDLGTAGTDFAAPTINLMMQTVLLHQVNLLIGQV